MYVLNGRNIVGKVSKFLRASCAERPTIESTKVASDLMKGPTRTTRQKTQDGDFNNWNRFSSKEA